MLFDIHTHILPGVDDGSKNLELSREMLQEQVKNGVTDVVLTPHTGFNSKQWYEKDELMEKFLVFKEQVKDIPINLYLGSEILVLHGYFDGLKAKRLKSLNDSRYILIEFPFHEEKEVIFETAYNTSCYGYIPIIAHLERYHNADLDLAKSLKANGCLIQINTSSILGDFGHSEKKKAKLFLKNNLVDFVASDCHSMGTRKPNLDPALKYIYKKYHKVFTNELPKINEPFDPDFK